MQAYLLKQTNEPLQLETHNDLQPAEKEVVVELRAASLNRRDFWMTQGKYPGLSLPVIPGSDGAGIITEVGSGVAKTRIGEEVIINPGWNWGDNQEAQQADFEILGMPANGTFATHVLVPETYLHPKPDGWSFQEAAALPLAGVTAYRALISQGKLQAGERVLINGIGGGVATFLLQYAVAMKAEVFVTSSSSEKIQQAITLGATAGFDYTAPDWAKQAKSEYGAMNLMIDSAGGKGYSQLLELADSGGRIVNYGATTGPAENVDLFKIFWKQLHLIGSTMGSPDDFKQMLQFVQNNDCKPIMDEVFPLAEINTALERMRVSSQFGKLVLDCTQPE